MDHLEDKKTPLVGGQDPSDDAPMVTSYQTEELRGYLLKKTRNGKWQKRWFETNGCFLTYYKKQGQKLLAALNLPQVGEIVTLPEDTDDGPGLFSIELNERIYTIKAKHQEEAALWVEALVWRQKGGVVAQTNGDDALFLHAAASAGAGDDGDLSPKAPGVVPSVLPKAKEERDHRFNIHDPVEETEDVRRCGCGCAIQ
ncbi:hypothetical protein H257_08068 [Aphanomyces astaci]|uniref:PH domain-containing protein n=1 Tax=Aphanomyces astaci TaxID=112090 RepID=W4GI17_APHAT|nr:hypothetical protein H257_08068 [Aphanomyces astaci]ETV78563.1 hypothetical protein H257_08068 [Aphanomyces astaci]|eukprot:XP_009832144.1 hypothetical protein H257_08068 [Aphanomyces astaci]